ncbi:ARM repeat-containing protein [Auriculariales sp. MPI-PUGE-AT-0066]|nr:ARM repeat-containing protein [Auriculariales sp. MPI-PUGE-AT-0066]
MPPEATDYRFLSPVWRGMGKAQKQKQRQARRHNPTRVPDSQIPQGLDAAASTSTKTQQVLPIVNKLDSAEATDRVWACAAVCNLIQNDPSTRRLLQGKNIVGALITRLSDSVEEVVVEAAGALRNLCIDGGHEICAEMYNKNIMSPLTPFIPKITTVLNALVSGDKSAPDNAQRLVCEFAENVITLLWCLAETSNKALNAVNALNLQQFLMGFLFSRDKLPLSVTVAAAQCIFVLSDDNDAFAKELRTDGSCITCLVEIAQSEKPPAPAQGGTPAVAAQDVRHTQLRVLSCAILKNLSPFPPMVPAAAIDIDNNIVLPLMAPLLTGTSLQAISERVATLVPLAAQQKDATETNPGLKTMPKSDDRNDAQKELDVIEDGLRAVQLALEVLTGVCATLPEPEPAPEAEQEEEEVVDEDGDDSWADDNAKEGDKTLEMDMETRPDSEMDAATGIPLSQSPILSLVPTLLTLAQPTPLSFPPQISSTAATVVHPPITSVLGAIHVRALECVTNIFLSSSGKLEPAQSGQLWTGLWTVLGAVGKFESSFPPGQERRAEIWDAASGALWGIAKAGLGVIVPEEEPTKVLVEAVTSATDPRMQVKLLGVLECLAQNRNTVPANKAIADFLISILPSPMAPGPLSVEPTLQAASAVIDIFSDEDAPYDVNFRQGGFTERLSAAVQPLRKTVRAVDRRSDGGRELRLRGDEVLENMVAFVKYRRSLGKGF